MNEEVKAPKRILIADDESLIRNLLLQILGEKYLCVEVSSAEAALEMLAVEKFNLVISDIQMSGISGLELAPRVREISPNTVVVMISGQQSIDYAIKAMRAGAFDFITKPFDFEIVETVVQRAIEYQSLLDTKRHYENHLEKLVVERTKELQQEIFERQHAEEKVNRLAYYDSLTNLPNATLFRDSLTDELTSAGGNRLATILISIDRFKSINDTLGYATGDQLLNGVAERLLKITRETDTLAYFGGDEFALLLREISGVDDVTKVLPIIQKTFSEPFVFGVQEIFVTVTFGVSIFPDDGKNCQTLLKNSGAALNQARKNGNSYQFFTHDMQEKALRRLSLESSLRRALERDEFVLYYQPQVCSQSGKITGVEALVRWQHPELGLVPPNDFIQIAEETGMIVPIGEWILTAACRQQVVWQNAGFTPLRMGVNLSLRQLQQPDLVEMVNQILTETGFTPSSLELEVTESLMMSNAIQTKDTLEKLRARRIKISIDDFGTGYSSLSHLKNIPLDVLKIDRSFVRDMMTDPNIVATIKTIIDLAHNFMLKTIAEGVETEDQASFLRQLGCDEMQGYLFGKPLPPEELETLLTKQKSLMFGKSRNLIAISKILTTV